MKNITYSDEQLVGMLQAGGDARLAALHYVYQNWHGETKAILISRNVKTEDAEDAIGDAIVEFDKKVRAKDFVLTGALQGFFIAICKKKNYTHWRSKQKSDARAEHFVEQLEGTENNSPEYILLQEEKRLAFEQIWNMLEQKCIEVLSLYRLGHKSAEIAELADLDNANNARQWTHKCRKRLKELIGKSSYFKN